MKYLKTFENHYTEQEKNENSYILYYALDWDDNILNMPTVIHMERLVDGEWVPTTVSTAEFAEVRGDSENWRLGAEPFSEFRDFGPRGDNAFLEDMKTAISKGKYGPAWDDFIECLVNGSLFAIITARGHEPAAMRKGVEWIIDNVLTKEQQYEMYDNLGKFLYLFNGNTKFDRVLRGIPSQSIVVRDYLNHCEYVGVSSLSRGGSPANPEAAKEDVLMEFKDKINKYAASIGREAKIGFSDDDLKNVKHIEDLIDNLSKERFPHIASMMVKGTKDPQNITKKIRTFESQTTPGLESSIMPFSSFNVAQGTNPGNFTPGGNEDRQDDYGYVFKKQVKQLGKMDKEICKECECEECECVGNKCKCRKTTCRCK